MNSVIVTVVVILGIIVAGGFLLYFLGDILMSISGKKKDSDAIREKQLREQKELEARVNALENSQAAKNDPQIATVLYNGGTVEAYNPDEEEVEEQVVEENEESESEEQPAETTEEVEEPTEQEEDETSEYIRQRRKELLERLARMQENNEEEEEEEEESSDTVDLTEEAPEDEEVPAEEPVEEETTEETPAEEVNEEPETPVETPVEEVAEKEEKKAVEKAEETITVQLMSDGANSLAANFTLEELEARLIVEQDKLKQNEKELRQNKKEFIPLRRVKNTLESDEKKLRRKEALVAKQKVVLYGVNNYTDIDEEKAQKLAEDLDLLDGLKLSVQHCQEVMEKNAERYPLLETIYNLLSSQNAQIKSDIKSIQDAIEILKKRADEE